MLKICAESCHFELPFSFLSTRQIKVTKRVFLDAVTTAKSAVIYFLIFSFQIGLTSYLEMFKRAPESLSMFPFLKHLSNEDLEFYSQLRDHAVRVTGVLSMLIRQVRIT